MSNKIGGGGVLTKTKRVFLASGTAYEGYGVCYNWDAVGVTAENDTLSVNTAITDWCDARRVMVEVPNATNNLHFAGVVDHASDGVVGPNWILIHEPGSICNVYSDATITAGAADTPAQNTPVIYNFTIGMHSAASYSTINGLFNFQGLPGEGAAIMLEEGTAGLKMAQLLTGPPSGGVQVLGTNVTITVLAVNSDLPMIGHGKVVTSVAADYEETCTISVPRATGHHFIGQRLIFDGQGVAGTTALIHTFSLSSCEMATVLAATSLEVVSSALVTVESSAACWFDFEWNGKAWFINSCSVASSLLTA